MNKAYFAYIRVSTVKQGERGSSLTEQKGAIETYAAHNGLSIAGWFEEVETAAKQGRRVFTQMLAELRAGKADGLVIHKIDRSARNLRDWADLGDLIDRGIDVRFVSDNFDLLSRGGRLSADIQAVVAADYIRNLREEVKKGMYGRLKQGLYPWAAPIGYLNCGKGRLKVIDPVKGPLVRHMFELYATNTIAFEELRHEMWGKGLRNAAGKPLYDNTLTAILNNPFYMGVIRISTTAEMFPGAHEPLIPKKLFERVQRILRGKTVPKAKRHELLLRQMVKCGNCSSRHLTGERQKGSIYYRCHGERCQGVSWKSDVLEAIALDHIQRIRIDAGDIGDLRDLVENEYRSRDGDIERLKASLALRLHNLDARLTRLTDLLVDNLIDGTTFNARKENMLMERQGILEEIDRAATRSPLVELFEKFERNNGELLSYESLLDDEKRELIDTVCSNFSIHGETSTFTLRTPYREILESANLEECAHHRDDVRTESEHSSECVHDRDNARIRQIFDVLKNIAEKRFETARESNVPVQRPQSPPSP